MIARWIATAFLLACALPAQAASVRLLSLGQRTADLQINQSNIRSMRPGETSPEGVRLVALTPAYAEVEANGQSYRLTLGQRIEPTVVLKADRGGHFWSEATINGRPTRVLVDTGATTVAFSRNEADRLGIAYQHGRVVKARTAAGETSAYLIVLDQVQIGSIIVRNVEATVSFLPDSPNPPLLGMSFLRRLEMATDGDRLSLGMR